MADKTFSRGQNNALVWRLCEVPRFVTLSSLLMMSIACILLSVVMPGSADQDGNASVSTAYVADWNARHRAATYVEAVDVMVHLSADQAARLQQLAQATPGDEHWDEDTASICAWIGQEGDRKLKEIAGLNKILNAEQRSCFQTYNAWRPIYRRDKFDELVYERELLEQMTAASKSRLSVMTALLGLDERQQQSLRLISKRNVNRIVREKMEAQRKLQTFIDAVRSGVPLTSLDPSLASGLGQAQQHPMVIFRNGDRDWERFLNERLRKDQQQLLADYQQRRQTRQAQFVAGVFVQSWQSEGLTLDEQQCVRLQQLVAKHLRPPFEPGSNRQDSLKGLMAVPPQQFVTIIGRANWIALQKQLPKTAR